MRKKFFQKIVALFAALIVCVSLVACGETNGNKGNTTVLKILAHPGGPGVDYFNMPSSSYGGKSMVQAFEKKYANVSFEPGKTGVTVKIEPLSNGKEDAITASISSGNGADVYYTWGRFEQTMAKKGIYKNVTDLMTEKVYTSDGELAEGTYDPTTKKYTWTGEQPTLSILDKMTAHKEDLWLSDPTGTLYSEGEGYYALPYEDSLVGFVVDYDLFKEKGWNNYNGVDGLPDTLGDFFELIERIKDAGMIPFTTCENTGSYWNSFGNAFILQYEGKQASAGWTYSGDVTFPVGTFDGTDYVSSENMTTNPDGSYTVTITPRNAWLLNYLPGVSKYINFARDVIQNDNMNYLVYNSTYDYLACQQTFITSNQQKGQNNTRIAMIFEGEWWENESKDKFSERNGGAYGTRDFRMMTIPYIDGQKDSLVRSVASTMNGDNLFINAKSDKYEVARLWIQFTHSESGLETYNMLTGLGRCFDYTLNETQFSSMTKFAQQTYKLRNGQGEYSNVTVVYPEFIGNGCDYYKVNPLGGIGGEYSFYSNAIDGNYDQLAAFFRKHTKENYVTADDFIKGMKTYNSKSAWESKYDSWVKMQTAN